ncbi:hypothetical protein L2E82_21918 [Cichorium intybus]|uniref:Uncharacterized protein n=1 Tax=Cichorium intybus TaxID=13427 RepID=A0ACB9DWN0_CICIN|nr:hypothetical protein L2E82_21918 [Cichorium intybus]
MSGRFSRTIYVQENAKLKIFSISSGFMQYGRILDIELKIPPRPPCYCFVEVTLAHGGREQSSSGDRPGNVIVGGLPSWQDLKIRKLDDTGFRNP